MSNAGTISPHLRRRRRALVAAVVGAAAIVVLVPVSSAGAAGPASTAALPSPAVGAAPGNSALVGWRNPYLAPRANNNIHVDSYSSDTYAIPGPTSANHAVVKRVSSVPNPNGGRAISLGLGGTQTFDAAGHLITLGVGRTVRTLALFDRNLNALSVLALPVPQSDSIGGAFQNFAGAYYYLDQNDHPTIAQANGHIVAYRAVLGTPGHPGTFLKVRDIDVTSYLPSGEVLYAVMPDKAGTIWFTTKAGTVGTVTLSGRIHTWHAPAGVAITKSMSVDEGDAPNLPSGMYTPTDSKLYRFEANAQGQIRVAWSIAYDRGRFTKPGQVGLGTGTTPTLFMMNGQRYVTINDNATPMHINVYRAADNIGNAPRLFAQIAPFGNRIRVADENSLIAFPTAKGAAIIAENNWGYFNPVAASFWFTTQPGVARVDLTPSGQIKTTSINMKISVPSIVSQANIVSGLMYTYAKRTDGYWYLTALDLNNLNKVRFAVRTGKSTLRDPLSWNNNYSQLSIGNADGYVYIGVIGGMAQVRLS